MKHDFHAHFAIKDAESAECCVEGSGVFKDLSVDTRVRLLAQGIGLGKDVKVACQSENSWRQPSGLVKIILSNVHSGHSEYDSFIKSQLNHMSMIGVGNPVFSTTCLVPGWWALQFRFTLSKPYISKDDNLFYIIDNPVKTEKLFGVPYMSATSWKGSLRNAMRVIHGWDDSSDSLTRLFGNPREEKERFHAGDLVFFPSYFEGIGLEVINPHVRSRGVGTQPVFLESVPIGTTGTFSLLYAPFYYSKKDYDALESNALHDLKAVATGLEYLLLANGFGAKTSSGFGVTKDKLPENGQVILRTPSANQLRRRRQVFTESFKRVSELRERIDALVEEVPRT